MYYKLSIIVLTNTKVRHKNVNKKRVTNLNLYYPFKGVERESYFKFHFFFLVIRTFKFEKCFIFAICLCGKSIGKVDKTKNLFKFDH